jgi:hypothetical protein
MQLDVEGDMYALGLLPMDRRKQAIIIEAKKY